VAGNSAYHVAELFDFPQWYSARLLPLLAAGTRQPEQKLLVRRILWMLGEWCDSGALTPELRQSMYAVLLQHVADADLVIGLTALATIRVLVDDCEFDPESFGVFVEPLLAGIFKLLQVTTQCDSKMGAMSVLALLIERLGSRATDFAPQIFPCLPAVWQFAAESEDANNNMLKSAVVVASTNLTGSLGSRATEMHEFTVPMVQYCTDLSQPDHVYLMEDGLELWRVTIQNSTAMGPADALLAAFANIRAILARDYDNLIDCMQLICSYMLLGRDVFMAAEAQNVAGILTCCLGEVNERGHVAIAEAIETMVQLFPAEAPGLLADSLKRMLAVLVEGTEPDSVLGSFLAVLGRVMFAAPDAFWELLTQLCAADSACRCHPPCSFFA
jgi:hypothetical protein